MNDRKLVRIFVSIVVYLSCLFASSAPSFIHVSYATSISDLAWMSGSWMSGSWMSGNLASGSGQTAGGRAQVEEHWTRPAGGSMIGMSRTVVNEKTVEFEFLRVEQRGNEIFYVASPNGRCPATDFKLTRLSGQQAIFENPEHDFPKRIIYQKLSDGTLKASIDGGEGTKAKSFAYVPLSSTQKN